MDVVSSIGLRVFEGFLTLVLPIFGTIIAGVVTAAVIRWLKAMNIQLDAEQEESLRQLVRRVIAGVEELARRQPMTGKEKLRLATEAVTRRTPLTSVQAEELIHQELPKERARWSPVNSGLPGGGLR